MLKILALLIGIAHAQVVSTNTYLIFPTQAAALARSKQLCIAAGCDGVNTIYWWNVVGPLSAGTAGSQTVTAGSYAVEIQATGRFAASVTSAAVKPCATALSCTLTPAEKAELVTAAQITPLLPVVSP